jgi:hypothetical protein
MKGHSRKSTPNHQSKPHRCPESYTIGTSRADRISRIGQITQSTLMEQRKGGLRGPVEESLRKSQWFKDQEMSLRPHTKPLPRRACETTRLHTITIQRNNANRTNPEAAPARQPLSATCQAPGLRDEVRSLAISDPCYVKSVQNPAQID